MKIYLALMCSFLVLAQAKHSDAYITEMTQLFETYDINKDQKLSKE